MDVYSRIEAPRKLHHLSFISDENGADKWFKALRNCKCLRTFLAIRLRSWYRFDVSVNVLKKLLPQMKFVRVLSLAGYNITEIPQFVCSLKHLRHLNFSKTKITCLPTQVGDLHNLQSLLVSGCSNLSSLPNSMVKLVNMRHLDISHTPTLNKMLLGTVGLRGLQNLTKIVIGKDDVFAINDLKGLMYLQGELSIKGLQEVKDAVQAKEANLRQIKGICELYMEWSDDFDVSRDKETEYEVLEGLRPFEKLRSLKISYYGGTKFPSWVGDPSFLCLNNLTLRGCRSCKRLPALGHLPSLRVLSVEGMDELERLDFEFLGCFDSCQAAVAFPSLEVLSFTDMKRWEEWSTSGGDIAGAFPCLRKLSMIRCEKLDAVGIELISPLWKLHVEGCSLKKLEIFRCNNLVSLVEKEVQSVTEVEIRECERLESYNCPSSIEKLEIIFCKSLTSLSFPAAMEDLPSTSKSLKTQKCDSLVVSLLANNFLSSIEHLCLEWLPNLRLFPEGCLVHLTELCISKCDNIESIPDNGYGFLSSYCLKKLTIEKCKNLKSFPYKHLQSLASLEVMEIRCCPGLDDSFPCGLWPPNLSYLQIGGLKKPMSEWGIQNFPTSLVTLWLDGEYENSVVTFGKGKGEESDTTTSTSSSTSSFLVLPSSLTELHIINFNKLESVREGLQHLTSLQHLIIYNSPKLRDLPETILPSLSSLTLQDVSPELAAHLSKP